MEEKPCGLGAAKKNLKIRRFGRKIIWFTCFWSKLDQNYCGLDIQDFVCGKTHCTKIPFMYPLSGNCAASVSISTFMCLWASYCIYSQDPPIYFSCSRIGRSIVGIYKSLTDTWVWKLGPWPRISFSGNICFEFSVLILCSASDTVLLVSVHFDIFPTTVRRGLSSARHVFCVLASIMTLFCQFAVLHSEVPANICNICLRGLHFWIKC